MGIDDRDYMRERYRQRQGLSAGKTQWDDKKARRELIREGHQKAVPLGSASWIIGGSSGKGGGGAWFDSANRSFDYQRIVQPVVWKLAQGVITHPGDPT